MSSTVNELSLTVCSHLHSGVYEAPHPQDQGPFVTNSNTGIARNMDVGSNPQDTLARNDGAEGYRHGFGA